MKIKLTFELSDDERAAIGHRTGKEKADHAQCLSWIDGTIRASLGVLVSELDAAREVEKGKAQQKKEW